ELVVASPQTGHVSPVEGSDGIRFGAWSPDGRRIAGTSSAGTVVILDRAGRQRILARETELDSWSPDGRWLLVRRGQRKLGLVHPGGGRVHWLASSELTDSLGGLIWDPTGTTIYGMRYRTVIALPLNGPARLVPVAPPAPTLLDPPDAVVSLLPGNTRLTLTLRPVDGSLYSVGADGLRVRAFGPLLGEWPAWSPDGSRVAYTSGFTNGDLFVADADGQNARDLGVRGSRPAWSPDGSMIAFDRNLDTTGGWGGFVSIGTEFSPTAVEVLTLSDGAVRTLGAGQHPTWSPDGSEMAAARSGEIVAFSLATSAVRTLTNLRGKSHSCAGYRAQQPAWGPDGRSIAYTEWFSGCGESTSSIALLDLASGRTAALTVADKFAGDEDPAWAPDGSEVAYASHMSSPEQALAAVGVRRPGSRSLYAGPGGGAEPAWQPAACPTASG
ncbi:MAG: TolB protein, partial [Gaiellaceae bacterium]|nr:TolB protein [Gaiellaceae bacterium]